MSLSDLTPYAELNRQFVMYGGAVVGIGIALIAISFILGKFFDNRKMQEWAKAEVLQMVTPFLLMLVLFMLVPLLNPLIDDMDHLRYAEICNNPDYPEHNINEGCHAAIGGAFLNSITQESVDIQRNIMRLGFFISLPKSVFSMPAGGGMIGATGSIVFNSLIFIFTNTSMDILLNMSRFLTTTIMVSGGFLMVYRFLVFSFVPVLTLGLLLRIIPVTRPLGGLLMSIAIVSYLFMPMMLVFADSIYMNIVPDENNGGMRISKFAPTNFDFYDFNGTGLKLGEVGKANDPNNPGPAYDFSKALEDANAREADVISEMGQKGIDFENPNNVTVSSFIADIFNTNTFLKGLKVGGGMAVGMANSVRLMSGFIFPTVSQMSIFYLGNGEVAHSYISPLVFILVDEMTNVWIFIGLMLYISAISVIAVIKTLSPFLGGDVEIAGLTKLI
ncbi:MAG: hypothetical protein NTY68_03445 [Candidatus Micrarchaeota archaeon]|nr:hypothetical protein [Candidatus Micrarchaeota archaeon]